MAEFEELRLTVNLVDNASAGLQRIRQEIGQLTQSAQGMTQGLANASAGLGTFSNQSKQAAASATQLSGGMKQLERGAYDAGRGLTTMATSVLQGGQALPMLAMGLKEAVTGLAAMNTQMAGLPANLRLGAMAIGGIAIAVTAVGAAAAIAGVMVFRFAREADQLGRTARTLGLSFGELKSAGEEAKRFGGSVEEVVRSAAAMQKAQADLQRNGSQLRAQLVGKGLDSAWLQGFAREEEHYKRSNMLRERALQIEQTLIARGRTRGAAREEAGQFVESLGGNREILNRREMLPPDKRWDLIDEKSRRVMDTWRKIDEQIMGINFAAMGFGLDKLDSVLKEFSSAFTWIDEKSAAIKKIWEGAESWIPQWLKDFLTKPVQGMDRTGPRIPSFDEVLRGMMNPGGSSSSGGANPIRDAPRQKLSSLIGANDNGLYQPASFGGGSNNGDAQSIIKGGVFDALVEFAAYAQGGGRGGGGGGGFQNAAYSPGGGVAAGGAAGTGGAGAGGFRSGGGYSVIPEGGGNAAGGAGLPSGGYKGGGGGGGGGSAADAGRPASGKTGERIAAAKAAMKDQLIKDGVPEANAEEASNLLAGQALSESELNPTLSHDQGTGHGIYGARLGRRASMHKWLAANGYDKNSLEGQSRYMAHEAMTSKDYGRTRAALLNATKDNRSQNVDTLIKDFEKPADQGPGQHARRLGRTAQAAGVAAGAAGAAGADPPGGGSAGDAKTPLGSGRVNELQQGAIRNQALDPKLRNALDYAAGSTGLTVDVWSGGQPSHGARRTGSHRHDHGRAGDFKLRDSEGKLVDPTDPRALAFYEKAASAGVTGGGHSYHGMGRSTHLDIAGGVYAGGPSFRAAMERGKQRFASGGLPDDYRAVLDRKALSQTANVNATGSLKVDVNAPPSTKVEASGGGLFKNTELQRSTQMPHTESGPSASATANQYMASR